LHCKSIIAAILLVFIAARGSMQEQQHGNGDKLGEVHFATSCNPSAQSDFDFAVTLLHSFQFSRAIDAFNAVLQEDPTCAIAYWGIALSDWSNPFAPGQKDAGQLQLGRQSVARGNALGARTERERAYLEAVGKLYGDYESTPQHARLLAYRDATGEVSAKYPADQEAQIFYALALVVGSDRTKEDPGTAVEGQRALLGAAGKHPGHCSLGVVGVSGGQKRGSITADEGSCGNGRCNREECCDTGPALSSAGTTRRIAIKDG
jgi:hypothetical protein